MDRQLDVIEEIHKHVVGMEEKPLLAVLKGMAQGDTTETRLLRKHNVRHMNLGCSAR